MEIKIDTSRDSKEELKGVIRLLQSVVGEQPQEQPTYPNYQAQANPSPASPPIGIFGLFGSDDENPQSPPSPPSSPPPDDNPAPPTIQDIVKKPRDRRFGDDDGDPKVIIVDY